MRVIGTAGHVDHGKSTLIEALTGTHPDRLKEEQARAMTIDLGFGWLSLPDGEEIGIVDVPGHRDFIENMLSGVGGLDAALLIIAADEGVMPQTREHLAILDLLQIPAGLIVLTKIDLASDMTPAGDSAWLDLLETDIRATVSGTVLQDAPCVRVSAKTGAGLDALLSSLQALLKDRPARLDLSRPRLPIDRVFTMSGFGTVVTGTLLDGHFAIGEEVEILPEGITGKIRGLQTHKKKEEQAAPGSRTAMNISGVNADAIRRGAVVTRPAQYQATRRLDAHLRVLRDASAPLKHGDEIKFFVGASEAMGTVRVLGQESLAPGDEGWVQIEVREPVVTVRGDRYIVRRPSPGETLGGGVIVDHQPKGRHKRFDEAMLRSLEILAQGAPSDVLFEAALAGEFSSARELVTRSRLEPAPAEQALRELLLAGRLIPLEAGEVAPASEVPLITSAHWTRLRNQSVELVAEYHRQFPLRRGIPREELKSKLKLSPRHFYAILRKLRADDLLVEHSSLVARPGHAIQFNGQEQAKIEALRRKFAAQPFTPPSVKECRADVGEELLNALIELNELVLVSPEVILRKSEYDLMTARVQAVLAQNGQISLAEVRDLFDTSRKYAQALLEHLDALGLTIRAGDFRRLKKAA